MKDERGWGLEAMDWGGSRLLKHPVPSPSSPVPQKKSSAVMPWRWVFESPSCLGGYLEPRLCDPLSARGRAAAIHAARFFISGTLRASYRLTKNMHLQHEHGRGQGYHNTVDSRGQATAREMCCIGGGAVHLSGAGFSFDYLTRIIHGSILTRSASEGRVMTWPRLRFGLVFHTLQCDRRALNSPGQETG